MKLIPEYWVKTFPLRKWLVQSNGRQAYIFTTEKLLQMLGEK